MPTIAVEVLEWLEAHPGASAHQKAELLDQVPEWQWATNGGHWPDLAKHCCNRLEPALARRPANALCVEIGSPAARCLFLEPGGQKEGRSNLLYLLSGGDVLAYGLCGPERCCRCGRG